MRQNEPTSTSDFFSLVKHPLKFQLYLLKNLPAAWLSGIRVQRADENSATVTVAYRWITRNPFRSTYFACLSMAAEMSTGVLGMAHIYKRNPPVSMLIVDIEGKFHKKATGVTEFLCIDGEAIRQTIEKAIATGEAQTITAYSAGKDKAGEIVADFLCTWSFKVKAK